MSIQADQIAAMSDAEFENHIASLKQTKTPPPQQSSPETGITQWAKPKSVAPSAMKEWLKSGARTMLGAGGLPLKAGMGAADMGGALFDVPTKDNPVYSTLQAMNENVDTARQGYPQSLAKDVQEGRFKPIDTPFTQDPEFAK